MLQETLPVDDQYNNSLSESTAVNMTTLLQHCLLLQRSCSSSGLDSGHHQSWAPVQEPLL
jgi:hypothetical protein